MVTTKITIEPHLAEYLTGKFSKDFETRIIQFPDETEIYHLIYDLLEKRPVNCPVDKGNVKIMLPDRRNGDQAGGKSPERFNYLGQRSQDIINKRIKVMMRAELHSLLDENKHVYGIDFIQSVHYFMRKYGIESISEDALLKDYQRWQDNLKRRSNKRAYRRKSA